MKEMREWAKIVGIMIGICLGVSFYIVVMGKVLGPPQTIFGLLAFALPGAVAITWFLSKSELLIDR